MFKHVLNNLGGSMGRWNVSELSHETILKHLIGHFWLVVVATVMYVDEPVAPAAILQRRTNYSASVCCVTLGLG